MRVLRLLKGIAMVLLRREVRSGEGSVEVGEDLRSVLWRRALCRRVWNSGGVRSEMDSRCRGAKGDVRGVVLAVEEVEERRAGGIVRGKERHLDGHLKERRRRWDKW